MTPQEVRDRWSDITADVQEAVTTMHRACNDPDPIDRDDFAAAVDALETAVHNLRLLRARVDLRL